MVINELADLAKRIKNEIWLSEGDKILGPYGFNMRVFFFKKCWNTLKEDFV